MSTTPGPFDPLGPRGRGALVFAALAAHVAAGAALWWHRPAPSTPASLALLQVDWVEAASPAPPPPVTPRPPRPVAEPPRAAPKSAAAPAPAPAPVLAAAPAPDPSPFQVPVQAPVPVRTPVVAPAQVTAPPLAAPAPAPSAVPAAMAPASTTTAPAEPWSPASPPASPPATPPATSPAAPRRVTLSATDWVRPPVYAYPREAQRRREQGVVAVRILFDTQGVPRQVSLLRSSGSVALDDEALAKARGSRARPRLQDGVPVEFLADTEAEFKF